MSSFPSDEIRQPSTQRERFVQMVAVVAVTVLALLFLR
jgi:hypothetical protein